MLLLLLLLLIYIVGIVRPRSRCSHLCRNFLGKKFRCSENRNKLIDPKITDSKTLISGKNERGWFPIHQTFFFFDSADFTFYSVSNDNDVKCDNWTLGRSSGCSRNTRLKTNTDDVDVERLPPSPSLSRLLTHFIHTFTATSGHPLSLSFIHALPLFPSPPPSLSSSHAPLLPPSSYAQVCFPIVPTSVYRLFALTLSKVENTHLSPTLLLSLFLSLSHSRTCSRTHTRIEAARVKKKKQLAPTHTRRCFSSPPSLSISPLSYSLSPSLYLSFTVILMPSLWSSMPLSS